MKKYTAFIVDDIKEARTLLRNELETHHNTIDIIGEAASVVEASKELRKHTPDILFLDIMLGDGTGFDILEILPEVKSKIIFITASEDHAIKAFKFSAIDYLLKPFSSSDLFDAIEKAKKQIIPEKEQLSILNEAVKNPSKKPTKLSLHTSEKIHVIDIKNIVRCQSDNNYTTFYLNDKSKILVSKTLKFYADILKETNFLRVHQSHLINLSYIKEFIKSDGGYLILTDNSNIPVSVRKRNELLEHLK